MYNAIILVIASDYPDYYIGMQEVWKKYMNSHSGIKSFFIKGRKHGQTTDILVDEENHTIYSNSDESVIPGILIKTINVIEYICENYEFKYIYRTNLSSFVNLNGLNSYAVNNDVHYGGAGIGTYNGNIRFASGCGFILSREACLYLLQNKHRLTHNYHDDVVIGELLANKFDIHAMKRIDLPPGNINEIDKHSDVFHYRCKNNDNMYNTVEILKIMYDKFYTDT